MHIPGPTHPRGASYVDIGSADGSVAKHVSKQLQAQMPSCYDVCLPENNTQSTAAMEASRKGAGKDKPMSAVANDRPVVQVFDGIHIPEKDASADIVSALFVLHHAGKVHACTQM